MSKVKTQFDIQQNMQYSEHTSSVSKT